MKISIITACYHSESTLRQTMDSVLQQSWKDYEYLVIDGGSKDHTVDIIKEYEPQFQGRLSWVSDPDKGIYDAMNKGIQRAHGDVVGFLNSDDYYYNHQVLRCIGECFCQHPEIDAIHGNLYYINPQGKLVRTWKGSPYSPGAFQKGWMPAHPTFYCKKSCFDQYGAFDCTMGSAADFELMLRLIEKNHIVLHYINQYMVYMRTGGASTAGIRAVLRNTKQNLEAFSKNHIPCPWHYAISRLFHKFFSLNNPLDYLKNLMMANK